MPSSLAINFIWILAAAFLVMFLQAGLAMVETGLCRAKNSAHTMAMGFMIYPLCGLAFWIYGFAVGWSSWPLGAVPPGWAAALGLEPASFGAGAPARNYLFFASDSPGVSSFFFLMLVFLAASASIPLGAMAERWNWKNFLLYGLWAALPYCLFANWIWGGGWLAQAGTNWKLGHGSVDFAGAGAVHAMGGMAALAGTMCLGPRIGKYQNGRPMPLPGHHVPMVIIGTLIMSFGWFGFVSSSVLGGTDIHLGTVVINTALSGGAGALTAMLTLMVKRIKPDPTMCCSGMLAGLVAITAGCAFVDTWAAVLIGAIAGVIAVYSVFFLESLKIDDPVGVISVHGINGIWGVLAIGIFANGKYGAGWNGVKGNVTGLLKGDSSQFLAQLLEAGAVAAFGFGMAYMWFKISDKITPLRVNAEVEMHGLDIPEMGAKGYPDFVTRDQ